MKLKSLFLTLTLVMLYGCNTDLDDSTNQTTVSLKFTHHWDGVQVTNSGLNAFSYTNAFGNLLSIERLRYLISDVVLTKNNGQTVVLEGYSLVDLSNENSLEYMPTDLIDTGAYVLDAEVVGEDEEEVWFACFCESETTE